MRIMKLFVLAILLVGLAGCGSKFKRYHGPEVTRVVIDKGERKLYLIHNRTVLKKYKVDLGFSPVGHKEVEGDGKTPEGHYVIDRRNPNSDFHLSLGISYPNENDRLRAQELGQSPGGDIFIHGRPNKKKGTGPDWTAGCISLKNKHMELVYAMVKDGTPISIFP